MVVTETLLDRLLDNPKLRHIPVLYIIEIFTVLVEMAENRHDGTLSV